MNPNWNDDQPIYRQLRDRVVASILEGSLADGDVLPSVRSIAAEYRVNPLTILKTYQQMAEDGLLESRRGVGMYVCAGARRKLLAGERARFLKEEWPRVLGIIDRLGFTIDELPAGKTARARPTPWSRGAQAGKK